MGSELDLPEINAETSDHDIRVYLKIVANQAEDFRSNEEANLWAIDLVLEAHRRGIEIPEEKKG